MDRIHADRPDRAARHQKRTVHRIHAAAFDQHPARVCRRFEESRSALGRQQSRCLDRQGRTAGLELWLSTAVRNYGDVWVECIPLLAEGWLRHQENAAKRPKRRRRGGQTCIPWIFAELTTPALRATPPLRALRGGE